MLHRVTLRVHTIYGGQWQWLDRKWLGRDGPFQILISRRLVLAIIHRVWILDVVIKFHPEVPATFQEVRRCLTCGFSSRTLHHDYIK
jgi:hypothetical protein